MIQRGNSITGIIYRHKINSSNIPLSFYINNEFCTNNAVFVGHGSNQGRQKYIKSQPTPRSDGTTSSVQLMTLIFALIVSMLLHESQWPICDTLENALKSGLYIELNCTNFFILFISDSLKENPFSNVKFIESLWILPRNMKLNCIEYPLTTNYNTELLSFTLTLDFSFTTKHQFRRTLSHYSSLSFL